MLTSHDFAASRLLRVPDRRGQATATPPIHTASATHSLPSQDGMGGGWCGMAPAAQRADGAGIALSHQKASALA